MRIYKKNNIEYVSVTTVLGIVNESVDGLLIWAAKLAKKNIYEFRQARRKAGNIGSTVHKLIEKHIKSCLVGKLFKPDLSIHPPPVKTCFFNFLRFEKTHKVKWIASEMQVYNNKHFYAGTLDAIAIIDKKEYIIDFKTSNYLNDITKLQLAAYAKCVNKKKRIVILLDKKKLYYKVKIYENFKRDFRSFLLLLQFYYHFKNRKIKNIYTEKLKKI